MNCTLGQPVIVILLINDYKRPTLGTIQTNATRVFHRVLSEHSHRSRKDTGCRRNTSAMIGLYVIMF